MIGDSMIDSSAIRLVYCPFADKEEAQTIARTVVREQLAACANVLGTVQSDRKSVV